MRVSIALASHNGENFILDQLNSFKNQSKLPDELIISDDCSKDNTLSIIEKFAKDAPFEIKLIKNTQTLGFAKNFNNALIHTTGDLVFLSDQDDFWFENKIEYMTNVAQSSSSLLFMNDAELTDSSLKPTGITKIQQIDSAGIDHSKFVMGCCATIKRDLLNIALPIGESFSPHDTWLSWSAEFFDKKEIHRIVLQYYRRHGSNESNYEFNTVEKMSQISYVSKRLRELKDNDLDNLMIARNDHSLFLQEMKSRLPKNKTISPEEHRKFISRSAKRLKAIEKRIYIRSLARWRRFFYALSFFINGHYKNFSGLKSFIRDILFE